MVKKTNIIKEDSSKDDKTIGGGFPPIIINDDEVNLLRAQPYSIDKILTETTNSENIVKPLNVDDTELISITCL